MCGKALKCIVDSLLLFALALQTILLLSLTYRGYWEIPTWVFENGFKRMSHSELGLEVNTIRLYPKKGIEIQGVQLKSTECICPLISIEKILVVPSDPLIGRSKSAKGILQNISLFFPDPYLPESQNLRLVRDLSLRFDINEEVLVLQSFKGYISNLAIASLNPLELNLNVFRNLDDGHAEEMTSDEIFRKLREIRFLNEYFENSEEALLTFTFQNEEKDRWIADLNLYAASSQMMENIITQGIYLTGKIEWDGELSVKEVLEGEIQSIRFGEQIQLGGVALELLYEKDDVYSIIPNRIRAHSAELRFMDHPFDYFTAVVHPTNLVSGYMETGFGLGKQYLSTFSEYNLDLKQMDFSVRGDVDPILIAENWVGQVEGMEKLRFNAIPHLSADFRLNQWKLMDDVAFSIVAQDVIVKEVPFQYARASGIWKNADESVVLDHFLASVPLYTLQGKLFRSFETTEYRYLIFGRGIPPDLNPMFKPWWSATWKHFDFQDHPIGIDIDIWGVQKDMSKRNVYGSMNFEDISYKGLQIDVGQVRLNAISKYLDLFDLYVQNGSSVASGRVENVYKASGSGQVSQRLNLFTNLPLHKLAPVVGDDLNPFVENTRPDTVADVRVEGTLIKDGFPQFRHLDDLRIQLHVDHPTEFFGFELEKADARIHKRGDKISVDPVKFSFAGGHGDAMFIAEGPEHGKILDYTVSIEGFDFREAVTKIAVFKEKPEEAQLENTEAIANPELVTDVVANQETSKATIKSGSPQSKGIQLKRPEDESYMDLVIKGSCPLDDLGGMQAVGSFVLDDPLIHRVHIFGGFSKVMDNAELNLGSFSLKQAKSSFVVDGRMLRLDDLELTGPSSRVRSKGVVNMENGELDFRLKAYPLGEVKFPVVAGLALVLRPFAHLFEVQLTGTFEEPEWKVVIDPSGL